MTERNPEKSYQATTIRTESNQNAAFSIIGVIGSITGVGALLISLFTFGEIGSIEQRSRIAIDVAAQHGDEFNQLRNSLQGLYRDNAELRVFMGHGPRFTSEDGQELRDQVDHRIRSIERRLNELEGRYYKGRGLEPR